MPDSFEPASIIHTKTLASEPMSMGVNTYSVDYNIVVTNTGGITGT